MHIQVSLFPSGFVTFLTPPSCAHQSLAESSTASFSWKQLWHTVSRLVTSRALCRPACYLLHAILAKKLVEYNDVVEWATSMLTMTEISAPASICDSSLALMAHLVHMRNTEGSGGSVNPSQNVVRWLFSKWNPGTVLSIKSAIIY
jgi:ataxia telangiectasia mutated family protein